MVGLPEGMSYSCNISNCLYNGGANGCAQISGVSPNPGYYNITIHITANLLIFGFPVPVPYSFEGYHIQLDQLAGISTVKKDPMELYPNPVKDILAVSGPGLSRIEIYNSVGKRIQLIEENKAKQEITVAQLEKGVYFIRLLSDRGSETYSFVKE